MSAAEIQPAPVEKIRIDQDSLTFAELADVEDATGKSVAELFAGSQARGMAALVWITKRRTDPTFTYEQALQLGPSCLETDEPDPEAQGVSDGASLLRSLAPGDSTRPT